MRIADTFSAAKSFFAVTRKPLVIDPANIEAAARRVRLLVVLTCSAVLLGVITTLWFILMGCVKDEHYKRPQFTLTTFAPSQPSVLLSDNAGAIVGWQACFSALNPNPKPISYEQVNASLWTPLVRTGPSDEADVAPFEQPPGGVGTTVCAVFTGGAVMEVEKNETVRFDALKLHANVTYKNISDYQVRVVCEDVNVLLSDRDGNKSIVTGELASGNKECRVDRVFG